MAILFPSPNLKGLNVTNGERLFAARLQKKLEDDYFCWFDVPVGRKQLRPDFIVLHPGRGILILEVKDWKLDNLRQLDAKTVELLTDKGIKHVANPLEQARAYALEVKELLERDAFLVEQENPRYKGRLIFPWGYGVVLTGITRKQFEAAQMSLAIPSDKVICKDEMTESASSMEFQERLWGMFHYNYGSLLTLSRIDRIRWHLFPEVRIDQGGLFSATEIINSESPPEGSSGTKPNTAIEEIIPELITVMDKEQEKVARDLGDGHRLIHGVAGSGKTLRPLGSNTTGNQTLNDAVQVLTMHASKGLEFNSVAIPDLGCMPYKNADEADEGRVLYVAMTRATHELLLSFHTDSWFTQKLSESITERATQG